MQQQTTTTTTPASIGVQHFSPWGTSESFICGANAVGRRNSGFDLDRSKTTCRECLEQLDRLDVPAAPAHLAPEACHVCGERKGQHTDADGHAYWSNADADAYCARQPAGAGDPSTRYVEQHRPA